MEAQVSSARQTMGLHKEGLYKCSLDNGIQTVQVRSVPSYDRTTSVNKHDCVLKEISTGNGGLKKFFEDVLARTNNCRDVESLE